MYKLQREQYLPISPEKAWDFFSSPKNLAKITPPDLGFKIVSGATEDTMREGQIIEYIVKPLLHIPIRWKSRIENVEKPGHFKDIQLVGPYKVWEHSHHFVAVEGGVKMIDQLNYQLPAGIFGRLMHFLFVRKRIEFIFEYRFAVLEKLFVKA